MPNNSTLPEMQWSLKISQKLSKSATQALNWKVELLLKKIV